MNRVGANNWVFNLVYFIGCLHLVLTFISVGWGYTSVNKIQTVLRSSQNMSETQFT